MYYRGRSIHVVVGIKIRGRERARLTHRPFINWLVFDAEGMTVGEYLDRWLDTVRDTVKLKTGQGNEINVRVHLAPASGSTKFDKLNPFQVQSFYRYKLDDGSSPASVLKVHGTLSKALKAAV
jgi:integrase